jgi:hypothetical protein
MAGEKENDLPLDLKITDPCARVQRFSLGAALRKQKRHDPEESCLF